MIEWTTARQVAFEKVCSTSETFANEESNSGAEDGSGEDVFSNSGGTRSYSFSNASESGINANASFGTTINQTGSTFFQSGTTEGYFGATFYSSEGTTVTDELEDGEIRTQEFTYSTEGSQYTTFSNSFSTSGSTQFTIPQATTTTESFIDIATITTYYEYEDSTQYAAVHITTIITRHAITENGTTIGNARDTVVLAESNEVLWVIDENPQWSKPLTDNAVSATRTTISDLREAVALISQGESQSIGSSSSKSSYAFTGSASSYRTTIVNPDLEQINATTETAAARVYYAGPSQSGELLINSQPELIHYGNTETIRFISASVATEKRTDIFGGSWQATNLVYSTTKYTGSYDNTVSTFEAAEGITSSCYGNTTKTKQILGGYPVIAPTPKMIIFSPAGVKLEENVGARFTGDGITEDETYIYIYTAHDGENTKYITASPVVPTWFTLSSNSFTYETTTTRSNGRITISSFVGSFGIDGDTWLEQARSRNDGLVGGDLGKKETGIILINRGLYKNQSGDTLFFEGNDTLYEGTKDTTYWYPISYLEPAFYRGVVSVFRNTTTWPSA